MRALGSTRLIAQRPQVDCVPTLALYTGLASLFFTEPRLRVHRHVVPVTQRVDGVPVSHPGLLKADWRELFYGPHLFCGNSIVDY